MNASKYNYTTAAQGVVNVYEGTKCVAMISNAGRSTGGGGGWKLYLVSFASGGPEKVGESVDVTKIIHDHPKLSEAVDQLRAAN